MIKIKITNMKINGTAVIIIDADDRVLLLRREPTSTWMPDKWAFPGGKIEPGESPPAAATRETKEETDLDIRTLQELQPSYQVPVFLSEDWSGKVKINGEHTDFSWVHLKDVAKYDTVPHIEALIRRALDVRKK